EAFGIYARRRASGELAVIVEGPAVVETLEAKRVAALFPLDLRPAMRAGVEECGEVSLAIPIEDQFPTCHVPGDEVIWVFQFRSEAFGIYARRRASGELAVIVEGPAVVETLEAKRVAALFPLDLRPAMRAGVEECGEVSLAIPIEDQFPTCHVPGDEVIWVFQF